MAMSPACHRQENYLEHDNNTPSLALSWWKGRTGTWRVWYGYRDWVWM